MKCKLSEICEYRKGKVDVSTLTCDTYISTENMLTNRGGIRQATSLPLTKQTQEYKKGDVLVSNIRPYFKKIWIADRNGGCSNDVLVFKSKEQVDADFLYYVLSDDIFLLIQCLQQKEQRCREGTKKRLCNTKFHNLMKINRKKLHIFLDCLIKK